MADPDTRRQAIEVRKVVNRIKPLLAGRQPEVQGAILADLLSLWLAGHHPRELREQLLTMHIEKVRELIEPSEGEILSELPTRGGLN